MYPNSITIPFEEIYGTIKDILMFEGKEDERCQQWIQSGLTNEIAPYNPNYWEKDKVEAFVKTKNSKEGINTHIYRFHQAAAYHRYYVLKDLLPSHGIAVY